MSTFRIKRIDLDRSSLHARYVRFVCGTRHPNGSRSDKGSVLRELTTEIPNYESCRLGYKDSSGGLVCLWCVRLDEWVRTFATIEPGCHLGLSSVSPGLELLSYGPVFRRKRTLHVYSIRFFDESKTDRIKTYQRRDFVINAINKCAWPFPPVFRVKFRFCGSFIPNYRSSLFDRNNCELINLSIRTYFMQFCQFNCFVK